MDAHALLTSQGWRGTGNSLHPTSNNIGLAKPLLVSRKQNTLGIGKKQHKTADMWWMNAFDSSLKGLDTSKEGVVVQTVTSGGLDMVARAGGKYVGKSGLYASFVRGEGLGGTIQDEVASLAVEKEPLVNAGEKTSGEKTKKRKRDEEKEIKEERRARKNATKVDKSENSGLKTPEDSTDSAAPSVKETKEERRARKAATKAQLAEQKVVMEVVESEQSEKSETKEERKERRRLKKLAQPEEKVEQTKVEELPKSESKEERKERKRLKKLAKESANTTAESSSTESREQKKKRKQKD